ncbi:MAG: nucleoside-diphosphate kinase [Asgard group archaeon]|nr:nucleoside-diphosphate kinase [Asgard group archaeon]
MEKEFIMIKPDGVQRGLVGEVIRRIEKVGFKIIAMKLHKVTMEQAEKHYAIHKGKPFYEGLLEYITSGPVVSMIVEGKEAVKITRKIVGATNPVDAEPGSIRGDYSLEIGRNIIHAADSPENAIIEYKIYFAEEEFEVYQKSDEVWIYE